MANRPRILHEHTIFLSHCGQDNPFVERLYEELKRMNLSPFFDIRSESLPKGETFPAFILKAAEQCSLAVIVLSERYLTSKWPMLELATFVRARMTINPNLKMLPLFYKLSPSDLVETKWVESWIKMVVDGKIQVEEMESWSQGAKVLKSINGLEFKKYGTSEGRYIHAVVNAIREMILDMTEEDWDEFENAKKDASERIETVARFSVNLEELLKQVIVNFAQCKHLVQVCSTYIQEIKDIYSRVSHDQMLRLYKSGRLRQLCSSLNNLLNNALMPVQKLLEVCGGKEWRRVALVLSLPPPDQLKYSGSKFALLIRELGWSLDIVKYELKLPKAPQMSTSREELQGTLLAGEASSSFNTTVPNLTDNDGIEELIFVWHDERCRYVLQRNLPESVGVAIDEMESLREDNIREALDRKDLLIFLESNSVFTLADFCSPLAWRRLWYNFSYGFSYKFAEAVKNRCQDISGSCGPSSLSKSFEIDCSDLKLIKRISEGGFKSIHQGEWLGQEVAIAKIWRTAKNKVEQEAGFLVTIHHPNVVDFFGCAFQKEENDAGDEDQTELWTAYLVMEMMEEDLHMLIKRLKRSTRGPLAGGPFSVLVAVDILVQIVEAMIHSHKHHVMHRDLKTKNCLVSKKSASKFDVLPTDVYYTVKVIDFGISKLWHSDGDTHTEKQGSGPYMAPEVWKGRDYNCSADVYSFGMVCYEVITGGQPFYPLTKCRDIQDQVSKGKQPQIPKMCPQSLNTLMTNCWSLEPKDRPTFEDIRRDLWRFKLSIDLQI